MTKTYFPSYCAYRLLQGCSAGNHLLSQLGRSKWIAVLPHRPLGQMHCRYREGCCRDFCCCGVVLGALCDVIADLCDVLWVMESVERMPAPPVFAACHGKATLCRKKLRNTSYIHIMQRTVGNNNLFLRCLIAVEKY